MALLILILISLTFIFDSVLSYAPWMAKSGVVRMMAIAGRSCSQARMLSPFTRIPSLKNGYGYEEMHTSMITYHSLY